MSFLFAVKTVAVKTAVKNSRRIVTSPAQVVARHRPFCAMFCLFSLYVSLYASELSTAEANNHPPTIDKPPANTTTGDNALTQATDELDLISDLLIVLDADGRSHTVQHTIASSGPTLTLTLPGSIVPQEVMFFGPYNDQQIAQYKQSPNVIRLNSGGAFARYQHQYGAEVQQSEQHDFVLTTPSVPQNISIERHKLTHSAITWVFPSEYELVSYTITDSNTGRWVVNGNTITFHHIGNEPVELSINYKHKDKIPTQTVLSCNSIEAPSDECAEDTDEDGVPDYRDICTGKIGQENNLYGCPSGQNMLLADIEFVVGRTYLDARARHLLDKVAYALLKYEGRYFEIGAHTDNEGAANKNQALSQKRANAVRHYLLLKGVDPNTLRATGYGEKYPIWDNASKEGRRANRRIELVLLE